VVGQFDKAAVLKQAEELFGNWTDVHEVCPRPQPISARWRPAIRRRNSDKQNAMSFAAELVR